MGLRILLPIFFSHELNPVNEKAQSLVQIPEELDLDAWLVPGSIKVPISSHSQTISGDVDEYGRPRGGFQQTPATELLANGSSMSTKKSKKAKTDGESKKKKVCRCLADQRLAHRLQKSKKSRQAVNDAESDIDSIPIVKIDLGPG